MLPLTVVAFALSAPPTSPARPPDQGALFYQWVTQASQAVRQTEFGQMYAAVMSGSMMGSGSGWFKPGQSRYGWKWLAERYDPAGKGRITRKEFAGPPELFDRLDRDRDGVLTPNDFDWSDNSPYWRQLSIATQWLIRVDEDGDRRLSRTEWLNLFKKYSQGKGYLNADDMRAIMNPPAPPPGPPSMADMPTKKILLQGLLRGELGSACEGPKLGERAPDFTLYDLDGKLVTLSELNRNKPVVLIFGSFT